MCDDNLSKKRNRKSKLVPREFCNENEDESQNVVSILQAAHIKIENVYSESPFLTSFTNYLKDSEKEIDELPTESLNQLEKTIAGINKSKMESMNQTDHTKQMTDTVDIKPPSSLGSETVILPETVSSLQFSINVEVEEYDDEYKLTIDENDYDGDTSQDAGTSTSLDHTIINVAKEQEKINPEAVIEKPMRCENLKKRKAKETPSKGNMKDHTNNTLSLQPMNTYYLPGWKVLSIANDILKSSNRLTDRILAMEVRNVLGRVLIKKLKMDPTEEKIQSALDDWKAKKYKYSPLFFKCYACMIAWWHLHEFREHMKMHTDLKIKIEGTSFDECNLVAYKESELKKIDIVVGDLCWRCGKPYHVHKMCQRVNNGFYSCGGCSRRFSVCSALREHESTCVNSISSTAELHCSVCPRVFFTEIELGAHYLLTHDVRSDIAVPLPYKFCTECKGRYFIFNMHMCPLKQKNVQCNYCFRKFTHRSLAELHMTIDNQRYQCKICNLAMPKKCMELEHILMHDDTTTNNFMFAYKCTICEDNTYAMTILMDDTAISLHRNLHQNMKFDKRRTYFDKILIPVLSLESCVGEPTRELSPEPSVPDVLPKPPQKTIPIQEIKIEFDDSTYYDLTQGDDAQITIKTEPMDLDEIDTHESELNMQESELNMQESGLNMQESVLNMQGLKMNIKTEPINSEEVNVNVQIKAEPLYPDEMVNEELITEELIIKEEVDSDSDTLEADIICLGNTDIIPEDDERPFRTFHRKRPKDNRTVRKRGRPRLTDEQRKNRVTIKRPPFKPKGFTNKNYVSKKFDKSSSFTCWDCGFEGLYDEIQEHMLSDCGSLEFKPAQELYVCTKCNTTHNTMKDYLVHFQKHGYPKTVCPVCGKKCINYSSLRLHINRHVKISFQKIYSFKNNVGLTWKCLDCSVIMDYGFFEHWETHLKLNPEQKPQVDLNLVAKTEESRPATPASEPDDNHISSDMIEELIERLQAKNEVGAGHGSEVKRRRMRQCIQCLRVFSRYNECKRHIIEHLLADAYTNKRKAGCLQCQICREGFSHPDKYKKHMRDHGSLPIFYCELCDKTFSDSSNFTKHKKVHNIRVLVCDICKSKFQAKRSLEIHMEMHAKTEPITCTICSRVFPTPALYRKHTRMQHNKEGIRYRCKECRLSFCSLRDKWEHMWEVHQERRHVADCPECPKKFRNFHQLSTHMRNVHDMSARRKVFLTDLLKKYKEVKPKNIRLKETLVIYE